MLNKDQYNQEEYNDYYKQETEGAKIKGVYPKEGNGKKLIIFLGFLLLGIAGYFGFNILKSSENSNAKIKIINEEEKIKENSHLTQSDSLSTTKNDNQIEDITQNKTTTVENKDIQKEQEKNLEAEISQELQEETTMQKMSSEEIANVVKLVMKQMQEKNTIQLEQPKINNKDVESDSELMSALSETMVDTINEQKNDEKNKESEEEKSDYSSTQNRKIVEAKETSKEINTYNKVTIQSNSEEDELSKLSKQISTLMEEITTISPISSSKKSSSSSTTQKSYTSSITREVTTRSNEMRIIIVRKGDTLGKIAKRAYGDPMDYYKIYDANPGLLNGTDHIYVGQKLHIPR